MNKNNPQTQAEKKKKRKVRIIILLIFLALIILVLISKCCIDANTVVKAPKPTPHYLDDDGNSIDGKAQGKDREEILKELTKQQLIVTDKLSSNITFPLGEIGTIGEWIVENQKENTVIQQVEVYFDELLIAKTTPIYPNQHITAIKLLEDVETGEYDVIAYINYYDIETKEFISKAGYKIHLTIQ